VELNLVRFKEAFSIQELQVRDPSHTTECLPLAVPATLPVPSISSFPSWSSLMVAYIQNVFIIYSLAPVAHTCNPSYPGGKDHEDHGSKPARANSSRHPILKIPNTKKGWWSGSSGRAPA
jgi:hypothetical protein